LDRPAIIVYLTIDTIRSPSLNLKHNFMANAKKGNGSKKAAPKKETAPKQTSKAKGIKLGGVPNKGTP